MYVRTARRDGETIWDGFPFFFLKLAAYRMVVDSDRSGRCAAQRRYPGDEAVLEFLA
jgi:hypothetical protein